MSQCCIMHMTCNNIYIQAQAAILKQGIRQPSATHLLKVYTYFSAFNHKEPDANYYKKHSDTNHSIFSNIQNFFGQKNFFLKFLSIFFTDCDTLGKETLLQLLHRISNYLQNIRALSCISGTSRISKSIDKSFELCCLVESISWIRDVGIQYFIWGVLERPFGLIK